MRLLLDSHVLLWAIDSPQKLPVAVRKAILDESNELYASVASIWEILLKVQIGKLVLPEVDDFLRSHLRKLGIRSYLPVSLSHVMQTARLPLIHKDPFDRLLVAQAIVEDLVLVSKDIVFRQYPVKLRWRRF